MFGSVRALVPAKINLYLRVGARRGDGYHDLTTVYHAIGLRDEITAVVPAYDSDAIGLPTLTIAGEGEGELPLDDRNLAVRAAVLLAKRAGVDPAVTLSLHKRIPVAGGLAGGSADGAAALVACDALWGCGMSRTELARLAAELGSDVPFLLFGETAIGTGRGERISPVATGGRTWHWVVAAAETGLATPAVYAELDRMRAEGTAPPPAGAEVLERLLVALDQDDPAMLGASLHNDLQPAALSLRPALRATLDAGIAAGALAGIVSGSGPTCVFLAADAAAAGALATRLAVTAGCRQVRTATGPVPGVEVERASAIGSG